MSEDTFEVGITPEVEVGLVCPVPEGERIEETLLLSEDVTEVGRMSEVVEDLV